MRLRRLFILAPHLIGCEIFHLRIIAARQGMPTRQLLEWNLMSVYQERREELEQQEFMMGLERGRLAITLDLLTDALVLVGQHGVYCQSARQPGKPAMDIQMVSKCLTDAKELVSGVMDEIKRKSGL